MAKRVKRDILQSFIGIFSHSQEVYRLLVFIYAVLIKLTDITGLGLAIVKHICAISDAELSIESDFGIGTTVTVIFSK